MGNQIIQFYTGELFELDILNIIPDMEIETDKEDVHRTLMKNCIFRVGDVDANVYIYLVGGKFIRVDRKRDE